jgi:hypothetical protein
MFQPAISMVDSNKNVITLVVAMLLGKKCKLSHELNLSSKEEESKLEEMQKL